MGLGRVKVPDFVSLRESVSPLFQPACSEGRGRGIRPRPSFAARSPLWSGRISLVAAGVEHLERLLRDALEHLLREGAEEAPGDLQRVEDGAVLVWALGGDEKGGE